MKQKGSLIVVSGFSGAGKGTLMKKLVQSNNTYSLSISMTTREPRAGEKDGVDYFFVENDVFEQKIRSGGLIEFAGYCGHYYGTPREFVEQNLEYGKNVLLEIEIQGAHKIKRQYPEAILLFVMPPSAEELYRRLKGRGTETEEVIAKRMQRACEEACGIEDYDYVVINDQIEDCVSQVELIVKAARNAPIRNMEFIQNIREDLNSLLKGE